MPDRAIRNSNTRQALTLKTQTQLNSSTKNPEKLVLLEPKLKVLEQNLNLIHVPTWQFETWWNSNLIKSELDMAQIPLEQYLFAYWSGNFSLLNSIWQYFWCVIAWIWLFSMKNATFVSNMTQTVAFIEIMKSIFSFLNKIKVVFLYLGSFVSKWEVQKMQYLQSNSINNYFTTEIIAKQLFFLKKDSKKQEKDIFWSF